MKVNGKIIAVTGGGDGIGRQVVLELLRRGARVVAVDIRQDALDATVDLAGAGDRLTTAVVDVTDRDAVAALPGRIEDDHGAVDGVINVAGIIQPFVRLADLDWEAIQRVVDVNLWGTLHVVKAFLPHLQKRPAAHVVTVSSMGGFLPVPGQAVYGATKAFDLFLGEALYVEMREHGVDVLVVEPGATETEFQEVAGQTQSKGHSSERIAEDALEVLGMQPSVLVGWLNWLRGTGANRVVSRLAALYFARQYMEERLPRTAD